MQKGYFFNAFPDPNEQTGYDRNYSADDISKWLSVMFTNGVVKTNTVNNVPTGLQVIAGAGLQVIVKPGFACINGKPYVSDAEVTLDLASAPTGANPRYDLIILRLDNTQVLSARKTELVYVKGTTAVPGLSKLTRNGNVYDLLLGYVTVTPGASSIAQADITDTRSDATLCGWFTAVKGYEDYYDAVIQQFTYTTTLAAGSTTVVTNLAENLYNAGYSLVEVYTNGLKEQNSNFAVSTSAGYVVITFTAERTAGAKINVIINNFLDGEGLSTAISQYNALVNDVENVKTATEFIYVCNGINDNEEISTIGSTFLNGGNDFSSLTIKVVGTFGYTAPVSGTGSSTDPYGIFNFAGTYDNRRLILDFTNCDYIQISPSAGKYTVIFPAQSLTVIGANIRAENTDANTNIKLFNSTSGKIYCKDCRFWINAYTGAYIAATGTFENCRGFILNVTGDSYCFPTADAGLVRVIGGEYYAYTGNNSNISAIVGQSTTNAVTILYGVSAPTQAVTGYYQKAAISQTGNAGWVSSTDLITTLTVTTVGGKSSIRSTIAFSKPGKI